jgi:hypothetical protein
LVPADLNVLDRVKAFKTMGNISGLFEIPYSSSNIKNEGPSNNHRPRLETQYQVDDRDVVRNS